MEIVRQLRYYISVRGEGCKIIVQLRRATAIGNPIIFYGGREGHGIQQPTGAR
jgi:hypothetical protein